MSTIFVLTIFLIKLKIHVEMPNLSFTKKNFFLLKLDENVPYCPKNIKKFSIENNFFHIILTGLRKYPNFQSKNRKSKSLIFQKNW